MFRSIYALIFLLWITPCVAGSITITLTDDDQNTLVQLLDSALRRNGVQVVEPVFKMLKKMSDAKREQDENKK